MEQVAQVGDELIGAFLTIAFQAADFFRGFVRLQEDITDADLPARIPQDKAGEVWQRADSVCVVQQEVEFPSVEQRGNMSAGYVQRGRFLMAPFRQIDDEPLDQSAIRIPHKVFVLNIRDTKILHPLAIFVDGFWDGEGQVFPAV